MCAAICTLLRFNPLSRLTHPPDPRTPYTYSKTIQPTGRGGVGARGTASRRNCHTSSCTCSCCANRRSPPLPTPLRASGPCSARTSTNQYEPARTSTNQLEPVRTLGCHCLRRPEAPAAPIARGICCTLEKMLLSRGGVKRTIICFLAVYWVSLAFLLRRKGIIFLMPTVLRHYHCVSSPPSSVLHVAD